MKRFTVMVAQTVSVDVDESKFTEEWMAEFRESFYPFHCVEDHVKHLAQLYARGLVSNFTSLIEGYGAPSDFGISFCAIDQEDEIVDVESEARA